ncbi:MAG: NADH-quinone oxidoreductase subunit C [Euryarchaeota archaeon]|nr:NADH-quinone oxidoreductase subunit C [Euryarchaeota archaeon]
MASEKARAPGPEDEVLAQLKARFPDFITEGRVKRARRIEATVKKEGLLEVAWALLEMGFGHCSSVTGVDRLQPPQMESVCHAWSYERKMLVSLKVILPRDNPRVPSLVPVWPGAGWHERESWDLLGIVYEGHPDLRRILNPDDWRGHPLRKDCPLPERKQFVVPRNYDEEIARSITRRRESGYTERGEEAPPS